MSLGQRPWLVAIAYTDLPSDARVLRETREELRSGARVTVLVPRSKTNHVPPGLEAAEIVWLPVEEERGRTTLAGHRRFMRAIADWRRGQTQRPDIVHVHNMPDYLLWAVTDWQRAGTRVVLDVHDIMSQLAEHRFTGVKRAIAVPLLRAVERSIWRRADAIITVHDAYADLIADGGVPRRSVSAVLNAPDPSEVHVGLRRPPNAAVPKLVFHGAVTRRSGIVSAVEAMPRILERFPTAHLLIIGTGDAREDVNQAIVRDSLQRAVEFDDRYVPLREAIRLIADADLGLVPTENSIYTRFMLPVKLTEYAALGIPSVATRLPLVELYFGDTGAHLLRESTPVAIANAVVEILSDPDYKARLSRGALQFAKEHDWSIYSHVLLSAVGLANG